MRRLRDDPRVRTHLRIWRSWSMLERLGDRPPCMQMIFSSTTAETGKQLKQSVKVFQSLIE